jgi:site-specific recombinase XerD
VSAASVNHKLSALKLFFEFCQHMKYVDANPVRTVPPIPLTLAPPPTLTRKDAFQLIRAAEQSSKAMETAVLLLQLHCGLKSSELVALDIGDLYLNPRESRIFIRGTHGKAVRFVYLTSRSQASLRNYCKRSRISFAKRRRGEPLFTDTRGERISQGAIEQMMKRLGRRNGIENLSSTILRNTCIALALSSGENPETVARSLGLSSAKSLQRFIAITKKETEDQSSREKDY